MLIVKRSNADIYYEGIDEEDCKNNIPNEDDYLILPFEQYDNYVEHLVSQQENLDMG